ncbi:hypothetical protein PDE_02979 [Penicillium oxalicum 114-2]|uniref:Selenoprotein W-like protein n=1 Tax=Penicillium oxalicum (strain 114-2 / CGMCC 5302) TaxID=933388 RepID=S7ZCN1_PENO1|nr:hypothetical protein PDE_02979 [Penicillium oxalicum 114-2]
MTESGPAATAADSAAASTSTLETTALQRVHLPRIAIQFCTQCRWMLRAAYFAQELLSTFGTDLGEVALIPVTGGIFTITLWHAVQPESSAAGHESSVSTQETLLWDRKRDGGFPEVKVLKSRVRNVIAPNRDLGHTDRALKKDEQQDAEKQTELQEENRMKKKEKDCEDCL